jgi:hypothetical protein
VIAHGEPVPAARCRLVPSLRYVVSPVAVIPVNPPSGSRSGVEVSPGPEVRSVTRQERVQISNRGRGRCPVVAETRNKDDADLQAPSRITARTEEKELAIATALGVPGKNAMLIGAETERVEGPGLQPFCGWVRLRVLASSSLERDQNRSRIPLPTKRAKMGASRAASQIGK